VVHDAVGLQSPGTVQQSRGELLQAVPGGEVEERGKNLLPLIWRGGVGKGSESA